MRLRTWVVGLVLAVLAAGTLWLWLSGAEGGLLPGLALGALAVLISAAAGWHIGVRLTRQRMNESLRQARSQALLLSQLQTDWQWQTDADHHLVRWQAPQAAPASSWVGAAATQALWERFELVDQGASLLQRLQERQPFQDVLVEGRVEGNAAAQFSGRWLLRGQVLLNGSGNFAGFLGIARPAEPTPQGQQAQGLLAGASPARTLGPEAWIQSLPGPAWLLAEAGAENGGARLIELNGAAARLMGRSADEMRGQPWRACLDQLPGEIRDAAASPEARNGLACGPWWLCLSTLPAEDRDSVSLLSLWPQGALDTVPAALAAEAAEVARAEHESFSYTVSHDLRAPLRVVEGFTRILKEDYGRLLDRIGNDHLERVLGAASRMNNMIDALLSLSQLSAQPLARQAVNLSQLATMVIEDLRRAAPERRAEIHIEPGMIAQGDPTLLRMVLENLLGNAWKYSSRCEVTEIRFERQQQGADLVFAVTDKGAGFDMRFAERLFGVFQRLHSASDFSGTGVGLASVRRIVYRHGGDIWAESEVGRGARFYFTLAG